MSEIVIKKSKPLCGNIICSGSKNAALLAVEILSISNDNLKTKLTEYRSNMVKEVERKAEDIKRAFAEIKK